MPPKLMLKFAPLPPSSMFMSLLAFTRAMEESPAPRLISPVKATRIPPPTAAGVEIATPPALSKVIFAPPNCVAVMTKEEPLFFISKRAFAPSFKTTELIETELLPRAKICETRFSKVIFLSEVAANANTSNSAPVSGTVAAVKSDILESAICLYIRPPAEIYHQFPEANNRRSPATENCQSEASDYYKKKQYKAVVAL